MRAPSHGPGPAAAETTSTLDGGRSRFRGAMARFRVAVDGGSSVDVAYASGRVLVGTGPACALRVEGQGISRRHCAVQVDDDGLRVEDLASKNGTFVGGLRVTVAHCTGGETLLVGERSLLVTLLEASSADTEIRFGWGGLVGASPAMRRLYARLDVLATRPVVLVEGEAGAGKTALARAFADERAVEPVWLDAGADPDLDGLEAARAASAFVVVEDVDLASPEGQRRLLAWASSSGSRALVATTARDLDAAVERGAFAEPLAGLLVTARVELPPLRDRRADVPLLVEHFARLAGGPSASVEPRIVAAFTAHTWPGNVRELERAVRDRVALHERLAAVAEERSATPLDLGGAADFRDLFAPLRAYSEARDELVARFNRVYCARAIAEAGGEIGKAARLAGVTPRYFNLLRARVKDTTRP